MATPARPLDLDVGSPSTNLRQRSVRGGALSVLTQATAFVVQLASTIVLARLLTPEDYGAVAMVTGVLGFVTILRDLGLGTATVQRSAISHEQVSGLFWIGAASGLALAIVIAAASPLVAWFYGRPDLAWITLAYAGISAISGLGAQHQALLQRSMRYASLAVRDLIALFAGVAVGVVAAVMGLGYWSLVLMQATSVVAGVCALWWQSGWRPGPPRWSRSSLPLVRFGGMVTLSNMLGYVIQGVDSVLLGYFFGATGVGLYNRAQAVLQKPLQQFMPGVMTVATSAFSRLATEPVRFERNAIRVLSLVAGLAGLVVALVVGTADWLVALVLGPRWSAAVPILAALSLFAFVEPTASFLGSLLVARGRPGQLVRWRLFSAPIVVAGLAAGIRWGPVGVAASLALSGLFLRAPLFFWYAGRGLGIPFRRLNAAVAPYVVFGLSVAAGLLGLRRLWRPEHAVVGIVAYGLLGAAVYAALVAATPGGRAMVAEAWSSFELLRRPAAGSAPAAPPASAERTA